jgi:hypothetical protein
MSVRKKLNAKLSRSGSPLARKRGLLDLADIPSVRDLIDEGLLPVHAAYAFIHNLTASFSEIVSSMPEMREFHKFVSAAEEEYMPSGPPMSPLTSSYFTSWILFDFKFDGDDTLAGCLLEAAETVRIEPTQIEVLKILSRSRMGIYENLGIEGKTVRLKDLATGEQHLCRPASNFGGNKGDLWYVRVLFKGFHHSRGDFIFLTGIPDRDATLPHA